MTLRKLTKEEEQEWNWYTSWMQQSVHNAKLGRASENGVVSALHAIAAAIYAVAWEVEHHSENIGIEDAVKELAAAIRDKALVE